MTIIRSTRVATPDGVRPATIHMRDGRIARVGGFDDLAAQKGHPGVIDARDHFVMPGLVDTHVHVNEPGRTEWEGFASATAAAAAGGITTILDMPLNSVPATTTVEALHAKREALAASAATAIDVEFIGGVVPGNSDRLEELAAAGVRAFKCFLSPSGVDDFHHVTEQDLRSAFPILARLKLPLMVHAEDPACLLAAARPSTRYADYLATRPVRAEHAAIEMLVRLMEWCPTPVHIVHLSSATSLPIVREARARGMPLTVETCPHYLTFASEDIPDGATEYKCAPPIRGHWEREELWRALAEGDIDLVATDHSPCPPALKGSDGDFHSAWGGIASLQLSLAAVWTGTRERGMDPEALVGWMSTAPARLAGLHDRKGQLAEGFDADIVIWDPEAAFVVDSARLRHRHPVCPYTGRTLHGVVRSTWAAGRRVYDSASRA